MAYYKKNYNAYSAQQNTSVKKGFRPYNKPQVDKTPFKRIATPSDAQLAIFDYIDNGEGNLFVEARAGTGKTSTIIEGMYRMRPGRTVCYLVFANRNALEAEHKVPKGVLVKTCHALGWQAIKNALNLPHTAIDDKEEKSANIAQALMGPEDEKIADRYALGKAMGLAKCYLATTSEEIIKIIAKHDIEVSDRYSDSEFADLVLKGLELSRKQWQRIDFNDMIDIALHMNLRIPQFDLVLVDEAQDLNAARIELAFRAVKPGGRIVFVGDRFQSIFAFTGADEHAVETIIERGKCKVLPLNMTYRCGRAIVELAKSIVPDYEASPNNAEGEINEVSEAFMLENAGPGDFILSRTNAPLLGLCFSFIKQGKKASVMGKELGKNLAYMVKKSNTHYTKEFLAWLDEWRNEQLERLANRKNADSSPIEDKYACLCALAEHSKTTADIISNIKTLFDDENEANRITLATGHKSKGLERDRVWLLDNFKQETAQDRNLVYVSWTRSRNVLNFVSKEYNEATKETVEE